MAEQRMLPPRKPKVDKEPAREHGLPSKEWGPTALHPLPGTRSRLPGWERRGWANEQARLSSRGLDISTPTTTRDSASGLRAAQVNNAAFPGRGPLQRVGGRMR